MWISDRILFVRRANRSVIKQSILLSLRAVIVRVHRCCYSCSSTYRCLRLKFFDQNLTFLLVHRHTVQFRIEPWSASHLIASFSGSFRLYSWDRLLCLVNWMLLLLLLIDVDSLLLVPILIVYYYVCSLPVITLYVPVVRSTIMPSLRKWLLCTIAHKCKVELAV